MNTKEQKYQDKENPLTQMSQRIQTVDKVPDESPGFSYVLVIPNSFLEN